jgi:L-fucose mutarotase/ribose pyranase (RbsD/FucU family)
MHILSAEPGAAQYSSEPLLSRQSDISWEIRFKSLLPLYGHRNWIVVADAAYPAQSNPSIETLFTGCDHTEVLKKVLDAIGASSHVRASVYVDAELKLVADEDAPGVGALRNEMTRLLAGKNTRELAHEEIIARLDQAGRLFRILILKSTLAIPYTSVFLELGCGYWSEEAEKHLRVVQAKETAGVSRPR